MNIKPRGKFVLVKEREKENMSQSGLIIATGDNKASDQGVILAIGDEVKTVRAGENVVFKKYAPDKVKIDDKSYLLVEENEIMAIIE